MASKKRAPRRKGITPKISEQMILDCLDVPVNGENIGALQSGAIMSVVDAFDRQIQREHFVMLCDHALTLHSAMGRMHTLLSTQHLQEQKELSPATITNAIQRITEHASSKRQQLKDMMKLVAQCPTGEDPIS